MSIRDELLDGAHDTIRDPETVNGSTRMQSLRSLSKYFDTQPPGKTLGDWVSLLCEIHCPRVFHFQEEPSRHLREWVAHMCTSVFIMGQECVEVTLQSEIDIACWSLH